MKRTLFLLLLLGHGWNLLAQDPPARKPVLVREVDPDEVEEAFIPDPNQARESVKIGDFYFKRKNYKAAENRYRQAVRHLPTWPEPYEKLVRALEKLEFFQEAADVCDLFLATNPKSEQADDFTKLSEKLRKQGPGP